MKAAHSVCSCGQIVSQRKKEELELNTFTKLHGCTLGAICTSLRSCNGFPYAALMYPYISSTTVRGNRSEVLWLHEAITFNSYAELFQVKFFLPKLCVKKAFKVWGKDVICACFSLIIWIHICYHLMYVMKGLLVLVYEWWCKGARLGSKWLLPDWLSLWAWVQCS